MFDDELDEISKIYSAKQHLYKNYYDDYDEEGYSCVDYEHKYRCESHEDFYREDEENKALIYW